MPFLESLIERGVMGNLATLQPVLSPLLWTSMATGKHADQHGILGFVEPRPDGQGLRPVSSTSRRCKALWDMLPDAGLRASAVGWWASHPAERSSGTIVSNLVQVVKGQRFDDWPLAPDCVQPADQRDLVADLRIHPAEISREQLLTMVPRAAEVDPKQDRRLATIAKLLADFGTIHAIGTHLAEHEDWDLLAVYYDSIDHFGHGFMRYRPPAPPGVSARDCEIYGDLVDHCYRLHDYALGRYLELVGPETRIVIVSDHGFEDDALRPRVGSVVEGEGRAHEHRDYGIFLAAGPGIRRDERIYGASVLDVCPTVLHALGLPVGRDMDGRVLRRNVRGPGARALHRQLGVLRHAAHECVRRDGSVLGRGVHAAARRARLPGGARRVHPERHRPDPCPALREPRHDPHVEERVGAGRARLRAHAEVPELPDGPGASGDLLRAHGRAGARRDAGGAPHRRTPRRALRQPRQG